MGQSDKKTALSEAERERLELLAQADEESRTGEQLTLDADGTIGASAERLDFKMGATDDPFEKYQIYYQGIQKLLTGLLRKGPRYKKQRDFIYEEKNIFLTRGHAKNERGIRGADGRMTYQPDMQAILDETVAWALSKGSMTDLYLRYRALNDARGYPQQIAFAKN